MLIKGTSAALTGFAGLAEAADGERGDGFQALDAGRRERRDYFAGAFRREEVRRCRECRSGIIESMAEDFAEGFIAREFGGSDISARFAGSVQPPERGM